MNKLNKLLTDVELAELLNVTRSTVRSWRIKGKGPRYYKLGGAVRYAEKDIQEWMETSRKGGVRE